MPKLFISYRRSDAAAAGRMLADALKDRFGADQVFFDTEDLTLGVSWHDEIGRRIRDADVVVALIGRNWLSIADEHGRRVVIDPDEEDVLRTEIETALRSGRLVVPVLVDDATLPPRDSLPRPFKPLVGLQGATLRHTSWDADVERFAAQLEHWRAPGGEVVVEPPAPARANGDPASMRPSDQHYADVLRFFRSGSIVPVLGSGINNPEAGPPWSNAADRLPTADELAQALADQFELEGGVDDLPAVSQLISLRFGPNELHTAVRELLIQPARHPTLVHRFLAQLPGRLRDHGRERYQLIVTANYDAVLERAFDDAREPFDLAVFMPDVSGGHFLHIPWWSRDGDEPALIMEPNRYGEFPVDDAGRLTRTVILKIHGGDLHDAPPQLRLANQSFVITEDDYIGYLSTRSAESLIPLQLLGQLRKGHLLFMGYGVRDWSLRVFLQRLWTGFSHDKAWAVQPDHSDDSFWEQLRVANYTATLPDYIAELERRLTDA